VLNGAAIGAGVCGGGMGIWAILRNEQSMMGSSALWSPVFAVMGAIPGSLVGIIVGLIAYAVIPAPKEGPSTAD
jgi:hypothetical protein